MAPHRTKAGSQLVRVKNRMHIFYQTFCAGNVHTDTCQCIVLSTVKLLIEAGSLIQAGSLIRAGLEMGVGEIDESEDENNEVLIDADDAD